MTPNAMKMPAASPKQPLLFDDLGARQVAADFSGGSLSSDGGVLLLRQVDRQLGLTHDLAACFGDHRQQVFVDHSVPQLLAQRIFGLALGYEDLNDHDQLRRDPLPAQGFKGEHDRGRFQPARLYEEVYCARGNLENQLKQPTLDLAADRLSTHFLASNQLRLWLATLGCLLLERLRTLGLSGTDWAKLTAGSVRVKLLKAAARVRVSVRRVYVQLNTAYPWPEQFARCHRRLMALPVFAFSAFSAVGLPRLCLPCRRRFHSRYLVTKYRQPDRFSLTHLNPFPANGLCIVSSRINRPSRY